MSRQAPIYPKVTDFVFFRKRSEYSLNSVSCDKLCIKAYNKFIHSITSENTSLLKNNEVLSWKYKKY